MKKLHPLQHALLPAVGLGLFAGALWVLHDALRQFHYHQILDQLKVLPAWKIAAALGLTTLSYLILTVYDRMAIHYICHPLSAGRASLASFISYAFSNSIGLSLLTAGTIRYRLYSAWGLATDEIARLVAFTVGTFWLGLFSVGAMTFICQPFAIPALHFLPIHSARTLGALFAALVAAYLFTVFFRKAPFRFRHWDLALPTPRLALLQLLTGSLDWIVACSVLFALMPASSEIGFLQFLGIYLLAQVVALVSHVPGGLGVFESMILLTVPGIPADALLSSLLIYRGIYYLIPLGIATLLLGFNELSTKKALARKSLSLLGHWLGTLGPQLLAAATLISGTILLVSGATPAIPDRLRWLKGFLPLPIIELSHFMGSLVGAGLLILARGIQRRLDAAFVLTVILLACGIFFSLFKGGDWEEALLLTLVMAALLPCRRYFYRRAVLFSEPFSFGWSTTVLLVLLGSTWLGLFAYKHVDYSGELWWQFALHGDAPRFLRAAVGVIVLLSLVAVFRLLRPSANPPGLPGPVEMDAAKALIMSSPRTEANLALLGDKALLFDEQKKGFVMFSVEGSSWVALGDPVGPPDVARELAWTFRELVERQGGKVVFYEVGTALLHIYLDLGLTLYKIGESARVPLPGFSLEGPKRSGLRHSFRKLEKEGCRFEVVAADEAPGILPVLKRISDLWLADKAAQEKGFSLGRFDASYLSSFPVAIVRHQGAPVAFSNLWQATDHQELSIDLMRFSPEAPKGVMDYLFINLLLWGKAQGYQSFDLGMAPLSGLENRPFAPLWNRIGAMIFRHGEHFYNFAGLRDYKDKFDPVWEPRYLVCPGGLALPRVLINIATLIGGGIKGVVSK